MGITIVTQGNTEALEKELVTKFNWLIIEPTEQMKQLITNYFGADIDKIDKERSYKILGELGKIIQPGFWFEEALKRGVGRTEHRSVIVRMKSITLAPIAKMYGYEIVSSNPELNPDVLVNEGSSAEEVINELRRRTKKVENSQGME